MSLFRASLNICVVTVWLVVQGSFSQGCMQQACYTHVRKGHCANYFAFSNNAIRAGVGMGGHLKISCLAINEICCSITDRFCFAVGDIIICPDGKRSTGSKIQSYTISTHFTPPKNCPLLLFWPIIRTSGILVSMLGGNFPGGVPGL